MLDYVAFLILQIIFELNMAALVRPIFAIVLAAAIAADSSCSTRDFIMEDSEKREIRKLFQSNEMVLIPLALLALNWSQYFYFSDC